jgi:hypothetical protein
MQLAHFAAFYKASWRANDWIYGRLDGIDRAIRIALNPDRLQRLYGNRSVRSDGGGVAEPASRYVGRFIRGLAVDTAPIALQTELGTCWDAAAVARELAWLDAPSIAPPPELKVCAAALTRRLHLEVLLRELPELARRIGDDDAMGAHLSDAARKVRDRCTAPNGIVAPDPEQAIALLRDGLLGADMVRDEAGSDHFTRTVSRAAALTHAVASDKNSGLKALGVLLKVTEWPVRLFHWIADGLSRATGTAAAVQGAFIGIGAALVAAALSTDKMPSVFVVAGWALLAAGLAATLLRDWQLGLLAAVAATALIGIADRSYVAVALAALAFIWLVPRIGSWLGLLALLAVAAWWSAGQPREDSFAALPCVLGLTGANPCGAAEAVSKAELLLQVGALVLLIFVLVLAAQWARGTRRWWRWLLDRRRQRR